MSSDLSDLAAWCAAAGEELTDVAVRTGVLAAQLAAEWADDLGREWAERVDLLRRAVGQAADDAAEQARELQTSGLDAIAAAPGPVSAPGPRLGAMDTRRVREGRGVRIPELPELPDAPP